MLSFVYFIDSKTKCDATSLQNDVLKAKCAELESQLSKKDSVISDMKQTIENLKSNHMIQIDVINYILLFRLLIL